MAGINYLQRLTGSTNNLVFLSTTDSTPTAVASNYITAQEANIAALNEGPFTWEANDCIMLSASDGISWCSINASFTTLTSFSGAGTNEVIFSGSLISGHLPVFSGTTGTIIDSGLAPSSTVAQLFAVTSPGSLTSGHVAKFNDANGTMADAGYAAANVQLSALSNPDNISDLIWVDVPLPAASLAAAGTVTIQASSGSKQYKVRNVLMNYSASGLTGGGGDRLVQITDGTTVYNNAGITAALLGTPVNTVWGGSGNPIPGTVAMNTSTAAGVSLVAKYAGGTADYASGTVTISVLVQRVA